MRFLFVPSLYVILTRTVSRHVSFKLEPTALSLKPLPKHTRDLSASFSRLNLHDLGELSNNLEPFLLPCCLNGNNFHHSLSPCSRLDVVKSRICIPRADVYNYSPCYGSNFCERRWNIFTDFLRAIGFNSNPKGATRSFYYQKLHYALDLRSINPCSVSFQDCFFMFATPKWFFSSLRSVSRWFTPETETFFYDRASNSFFGSHFSLLFYGFQCRQSHMLIFINFQPPGHRAGKGTDLCCYKRFRVWSDL